MILQRIITEDELKSHNSEASCWVALYGKVYDFTEFLEEHPAGAESILEQAGKDGTARFDSVHTLAMLEDFEALGSLSPTQ